jgi:hypothetical protein
MFLCSITGSFGSVPQILVYTCEESNFTRGCGPAVGQRIFFLHDGRTTDLMQAIQSHSSAGSKASAQQDLLNFLRSL